MSRERIALIALTVALGLVGLLFVRARNEGVWLKLQNAKLAAQLSDTTAKDLAAAKISCAARSAAAFKALGWSENGSNSGSNIPTYTNHYSPNLKRCLMYIEVTGFAGGNLVSTKSIFDTDERTGFGNYGGVLNGSVKGSGERTVQCHLIPPGQPERDCRSKEEWDEYVHLLMD